jgi:hypothetical protein
MFTIIIFIISIIAFKITSNVKLVLNINILAYTGYYIISSDLNNAIGFNYKGKLIVISALIAYLNYFYLKYISSNKYTFISFGYNTEIMMAFSGSIYQMIWSLYYIYCKRDELNRINKICIIIVTVIITYIGVYIYFDNYKRFILNIMRYWQYN